MYMLEQSLYYYCSVGIVLNAKCAVGIPLQIVPPTEAKSVLQHILCNIFKSYNAFC